MDILQGLVPCFSSSSFLSGSILSFLPTFSPFSGFPVAQLVKNLAAMWETWVQSLGWEDPLEKEMAPHSSILAWRVPWTEDPGRQTTVHGVGKRWPQLSNLTKTIRESNLGAPKAETYGLAYYIKLANLQTSFLYQIMKDTISSNIPVIYEHTCI